MSRNMAEYHGKSRHFPGIYRNITNFPMVAMRLFINMDVWQLIFYYKSDGSFPFWRQVTNNNSILDVLYVSLYQWLIPPELQRPEKQKCWHQHYFRTPSELCYTQNLVKNNDLVKDNADVSTFVFQDAVTQEELIIDSKLLVNTRNNDTNRYIKLPV
jgi:hypothetical protein